MNALGFPIRLCAEISQIPWAVLIGHEEQARLNHGGRSLEDIASRGGFTPEEAIAVIEDRPFELMPMTIANNRLRELVQGSGVYAATVLSLQQAEVKLKRGHTDDDVLRAVQDAVIVIRALMPR